MKAVRIDIDQIDYMRRKVADGGWTTWGTEIQTDIAQSIAWYKGTTRLGWIKTKYYVYGFPLDSEVEVEVATRNRLDR